MTLDQFRPWAERALAPFVRVSKALGLTPNAVSVSAFLLAVAAGVAFYLGRSNPLWWPAASLLVLANGWLDLVDGALARELDIASEAGDMLDHVLDRYADIAVIAGVAAGADAYALGLLSVTGVLMTSYLGTQIQAVGLGRQYGGLLGRADRLALVGVAGVVVYAVPEVAGVGVLTLLLAFFAIVGHFTALQRFWGAWRDLE